VSLIEAALMIQAAALPIVWLARGWKAALWYLVSVPCVWLVTLMLQSMHVAPSLHLVWIAPIGVTLWALWKPLRRLRT
jgi:hypothetical protein